MKKRHSNRQNHFTNQYLKTTSKKKKLKQNPLDDGNCQRFCSDDSVRLFTKLPLKNDSRVLLEGKLE